MKLGTSDARGIGRAFAAVVASSVFAACFIDATGEGPGSLTCNNVSECPESEEPCEQPICDGGLCRFTPRPDGPSPTSVNGDCRSARCEAGEVVIGDDPEDDDDTNPCTTDACNAGTPTHTPTPNAQCFIGDGEGVCSDDPDNPVCEVECTGDDECRSDCFNGVCDDGICEGSIREVPLNHDDVANDCKQWSCDENAVAVEIADELDVPVSDDLVCTDDICVGTVPTYMEKPEGFECDEGLLCDLEQRCVECSTNFPCPADTPCIDYECDPTGACVDTPVAVGDPCVGMTGVCNAMNQCVECVDPGDCAAPEPVCSAAGNCVACLQPTDCPAQECRAASCSNANTCSYAITPGVGCSSVLGGVCCNNGSCNTLALCPP